MLRRALLVGAALFGCTPENQCQFQYEGFCNLMPGPNDPPCTGHVIDATHWESGPIDGAWLDFGHNKQIHMFLRDATTHAQLVAEPWQITAYVSPVQTPNPVCPSCPPPNQFAYAAGNLAELSFSRDGMTPGWTLDVHNDSCADYFVYVAVTGYPQDDAGMDSSAVGPDASSDGTTE